MLPVTLAYRPAAHWYDDGYDVGFTDVPSGVKYPAGAAYGHDDAPADRPYRPAGHSRHSEREFAPVELRNRPTGHDLHAVCAVRSL